MNAAVLQRRMMEAITAVRAFREGANRQKEEDERQFQALESALQELDKGHKALEEMYFAQRENDAQRIRQLKGLLERAETESHNAERRRNAAEVRQRVAETRADQERDLRGVIQDERDRLQKQVWQLRADLAAARWLNGRRKAQVEAANSTIWEKDQEIESLRVAVDYYREICPSAK